METTMMRSFIFHLIFFSSEKTLFLIMFDELPHKVQNLICVLAMDGTPKRVFLYEKIKCREYDLLLNIYN